MRGLLVRGLLAAAAFGLGCREGVAPSASGSEQDVIEVVGHGARIDWTELELEVTAQASGSAVQTVQAAEQLARRSVEAGFQQAVVAVHVTGDARVADLFADGELGAAVRGRVSRWEVERATYGTSGAVELVATLSLQDLLRPWALQIARPIVEPLRLLPPAADEPTGLVIDARGTDVRPAYTLRLVSEDGRVLYGGELWEEQAVRIPPFRFVPDGAHPTVAQAGARPLLMVAASGRGSDLVLSPDDVETLGERERDVLLGRTTVVVVVDAR